MLALHARARHDGGTVTVMPVVNSTNIFDASLLMWVVLVGASIVLVAAGAWTAHASNAPSSHRGSSVALGIFGIAVGASVAFIATFAPVTRVTDHEAVAASVSSRYEISDVSPEDRGIFSDFDNEDGTLCAPVSLDSPVYRGVADGRVITFAVGFRDCDDPEPEILVVTAPDDSVTPSSLER